MLQNDSLGEASGVDPWHDKGRAVSPVVGQAGGAEYPWKSKIQAQLMLMTPCPLHVTAKSFQGPISVLLSHWSFK